MCSLDLVFRFLAFAYLPLYVLFSRLKLTNLGRNIHKKKYNYRWNDVRRGKDFSKVEKEA